MLRRAHINFISPTEVRVTTDYKQGVVDLSRLTDNFVFDLVELKVVNVDDLKGAYFVISSSPFSTCYYIDAKQSFDRDLIEVGRFESGKFIVYAAEKEVLIGKHEGSYSIVLMD